MRRLAREADELATSEDPGAAFFAFFTRVVGYSATKNAFAAALAEAGIDIGRSTAETGQELKRSLGALLANAQQAGAVRSDIGLPELVILLVGAAQAAESAGGDDGARDRALTVVFDGLRART